MKKQKCHVCGNEKNLKIGWTRASYCSHQCELSHVSAVHGSMPGGRLPYNNWVPHHLGLEISRRWGES